MRRLILMRHAKSSWSDPDQADHDRPLNERGRLASVLMGAWLAEKGYVPDHAIVSSAVRVEETWELAQIGMRADVEATEQKALYLSEPDTTLSVLRSAPDGAKTLLMMMHQPGLVAFLRKMIGGKTNGGAARAFEKFPTAAVAVIDLPDEPWGKADFGKGAFVAFAAPKDLV